MSRREKGSWFQRRKAGLFVALARYRSENRQCTHTKRKRSKMGRRSNPVSSSETRNEKYKSTDKTQLMGVGMRFVQGGGIGEKGC